LTTLSKSKSEIGEQLQHSDFVKKKKKNFNIPIKFPFKVSQKNRFLKKETNFIKNI